MNNSVLSGGRCNPRCDRKNEPVSGFAECHLCNGGCQLCVFIFDSVCVLHGIHSCGMSIMADSRCAVVLSLPAAL